MSALPDVSRVRFDNAMRLFDEFVQAAVKSPDVATLRGLERRFAERLQIQPSYWSQIKSGSRQIGERLARQFEQLCRKPAGWLDQRHDADILGIAGVKGTSPHPGGRSEPAVPPRPLTAAGAFHEPQDDDERFIVGLVLTYYRRHPQRARTRLLDLLGEVLVPTDASTGPVPSRTGRTAGAGVAIAAPKGGGSSVARPSDDLALWQQTQAGVAPLKRKV
jgi:hypothetical protein